MKSSGKTVKLLAILLCLVLCVGFTTACDGGGDVSDASDASVESSSDSEDTAESYDDESIPDDDASSAVDVEVTQSTTGSTNGGNSTNKTDSTGKNTTTKGGILVNKTTATTKKQGQTTGTSSVINLTTKQKILSLFEGAKKDTTVTILVHFPVNDTDKMNQMYEETGVKIKFQICELDDYGTRLSAMINASRAPDVAYMTGMHYPSLVTKGFVQDLSAADIDYSLDIFDKQMMENFKWNGKSYGLLTKNSSDAHFQVCFYNKTVFKRLGVTDPGELWEKGNWNWDTFLECAKAVNDPNNGRWGCELYYAQNFLCTSGVGLVTVGDGKIVNNLNDKRIVDAWTFVNKLHHEYKVTTGLAGAETNFATGKSAMLIGETWQWGIAEPIAQTEDEWGVVPSPCKKGIEAVAVASPRAACIPIGSKNPKLGLAAYVYWSSNDTYFNPDATYESDPENYPREELKELTRTLWEMPKVAECSTGIVEYGGSYNKEDFSFDVFQSGMSGINTSIDKWKSAIDICIRQIMTEFS